MRKKALTKADIKELAQAGYTVKETSVRHTFHLSRVKLDIFIDICKRRGMKQVDGINEALEDWIKKHS